MFSKMDSDINLSLDEYIKKRFKKEARSEKTQISLEGDECILATDLGSTEKENKLPTNPVNENTHITKNTIGGVVDLRQKLSVHKHNPFNTNNNQKKWKRKRKRMNKNNNKNNIPISMCSKNQGNSPSNNMQNNGNPHNPPILEKHSAIDLTIRLPSKNNGQRTAEPLVMSAPLANTALLDMRDATPHAAAQTQQTCGSDSVKSLLGINGAITNETIPILAAKFLDLLRNPQSVHKTVNDMKIQQDNNQLQGKCPGGEVISSDGAGINCATTPITSGMSMNYKFG